MSEIRTDTINNASGDNDSGIDLSTNDQVSIKTANTTAVTVDASQNVGIGTTTPASNCEIESTGDTTLRITAGGTSNDSKIDFVHGSTVDGGITFDHNGAYASEQMVFRAGNNTPHMYLTGAGNLLVGKTSTSAFSDGVMFSNAGNNIGRDSNTVLDIHRGGSDGNLIAFYGQSTFEGSISVSGTTISYNGGHLARWSRLLDNSKDTSIVKGTVMTNLDEMVEWDDENNEQLNKMAVSSVEGDANVAGVFVNWDDDDDYNDMNVAMTGDMVIRIAQGTTVARGDLLMSAGDGTAKPQGDDIVRSKTIAKVTSTNVSHTYDDGSYLVPCVLMAC